jgi:cephalosporin hydroxylase
MIMDKPTTICLDISSFDLQSGTSISFGFKMQQNYIAPMLWNYVIELERPSVVIEIGTHTGGFSSLMALACKSVGAQFHTFEIMEGNINKNNLEFLYNNKANVYIGDALSKENTEKISNLIQTSNKAILLCDGGQRDKEHEFKHFAKYLRIGDIVAAHDYVNIEENNQWKWIETTKEGLDDTCAEYNLEPYMQENFDHAFWLVRKKIS